MEIRVQALKFNADRKLLDFIDKKVSKIEKFDNMITDVDVTLSLLELPENKNVKLQAHVKGNTLIVEKNAGSFEEAVNQCVISMKKVARRNKEKRMGV